jgi:hypothetical protein
MVHRSMVHRSLPFDKPFLKAGFEQLGLGLKRQDRIKGLPGKGHGDAPAIEGRKEPPGAIGLPAQSRLEPQGRETVIAHEVQAAEAGNRGLYRIGLVAPALKFAGQAEHGLLRPGNEAQGGPLGLKAGCGKTQGVFLFAGKVPVR